MRDLIRFFSFRSYFFGMGAAGLLLALIVSLDGLALWEAAVLVVYVAAVLLIHRLARTPPAQRSEFDAVAAFDRVLREGRPTLLEFYSDDCGLCILNRPLVERVENEAGHRLQILRVNYKDKIGMDIANRYGVNFTPTFLLFNGRGQKEQEFVFVLDRARVLYWLDRQSAPRSA
jgi:thiol-disulfide isomerase/thioredoxin